MPKKEKQDFIQNEVIKCELYSKTIFTKVNGINVRITYRVFNSGEEIFSQILDSTNKFNTAINIYDLGISADGMLFLDVRHNDGLERIRKRSEKLVEYSMNILKFILEKNT